MDLDGSRDGGLAIKRYRHIYIILGGRNYGSLAEVNWKQLQIISYLESLDIFSGICLDVNVLEE